MKLFRKDTAFSGKIKKDPTENKGLLKIFSSVRKKGIAHLSTFPDYSVIFLFLIEKACFSAFIRKKLC